MSKNNPSQSQIAGDLNFDRRLLLFVNDLRNDVIHLLQPDQTLPRPATADYRCVLETLKTVADTAFSLAERERFWAERDKFKAQTAELVAEKEKIQAETEKIKAEKM